MYTTHLRTIIEAYNQGTNNSSHRDKIEYGRKKLFDFNYPIFADWHKKDFETKFIRNFYMDEIGFETEELFKFKLETWLLIHMPYYIKLLESEKIVFDPLINIDIEEKYRLSKESKKEEIKDTKQNSDMQQDNTSTGDSEGTHNTNTVSDSEMFDRELKAETPQDRLTITAENGVGLIEYASAIDEKVGTINQTNDSKTNTNNSSVTTSNDVAKANVNTDENMNQEINSLDDYLRTLKGKQGNQSYSKMLEEYRNTFLRIEQEMFREMKKLFMLIY